MKCMYCNEPVKLGVMSYVHMNGGMYKQYCKKCGWSGDKEGSYQECPKCQNHDIRDHHIIRPIPD